MTKTAAALLVLALAGSPVVTAACLANCQHGRVTFGLCHGMDTRAAPLMSAGRGCNDPWLSDTLYVVEYRPAPGEVVLVASLMVTPADGPELAPPAVVSSAAGAWLKPPVVLRL
jgi:hypothetical protein